MNWKIGSSIFVAFTAFVLAILAIVMVVRSKSDYKDGKRDDAKSKVTISMVFLAGVIVMTVLAGGLYIWGGKEQLASLHEVV